MSEHDVPEQSEAKRTRRAEPISRRVARNGAVSYEFRADIGTKPDGTRDRRRFTYRTLKEARNELRRITSEVAAGTYHRPTAITVDEACNEWLAGRRGIRRVTLYSYEMDLKPARRYLGGRKLQQLTKADGDALVRWMLTEARTSPRHYRADSLAGRVVALVSGAGVRTPRGHRLLRAGRRAARRRAFGPVRATSHRTGDPPAPGCLRTRAA